MAHKCGLPYVVPRAHSIHGASPSGIAHRSVDSLPHTNTIDALHGESHIKDSMVSAQQEQRMVKSEHGSPHVQPATTLEALNGQLSPLDMTGINDFGDYNFMNFDAFAPMPENEQAIFSAGLSAASVDWSHYAGLGFDNDNFATSAYSQAPSFTGFDFGAVEQPALTSTSTSGEISEVEDFGPFSNPSPSHRVMGAAPALGSEFDMSDFGDRDGYRLSTASSYVGLPQAQLLANNVESLTVDDFLKGISSVAPHASQTPPMTTSPSHHGLPTTFEEVKFLPLTAPLSTPTPPFRLDDDEALWMNDFTNTTPAFAVPADNISDHDLWTQ
jgi:hypothetical protein